MSSFHIFKWCQIDAYNGIEVKTHAKDNRNKKKIWNDKKCVTKLQLRIVTQALAIRYSLVAEAIFAITIVFDWYDTCAIYWYTRITFNWRNFHSISTTFIWIYFIRFVLSASCIRNSTSSTKIPLWHGTRCVSDVRRLPSSSFPSYAATATAAAAPAGGGTADGGDGDGRARTGARFLVRPLFLVNRIISVCIVCWLAAGCACECWACVCVWKHYIRWCLADRVSNLLSLHFVRVPPYRVHSHCLSQKKWNFAIRIFEVFLQYYLLWVLLTHLPQTRSFRILIESSQWSVLRIWVCVCVKLMR